MSQLPVDPLSSVQQEKIMGQLYLLVGKQVQSYYNHRNRGEHSSVPSELAQELMESIEYTLTQAGSFQGDSHLDDTLKLGQEILEEKHRRAGSMLNLVMGTAPQVQTECRRDALCYLQYYLDQYDLLHLAHKGPDGLFYPILIAPPEGIRGVDMCLFYLNILWIENQIMAGVPDPALEAFFNKIPEEALNPCEYLLINGMGTALIASGLNPLHILPSEFGPLLHAMHEANMEKLTAAANLLCKWLNLKEENSKMYVHAIVPQMSLWIGDGGPAYIEHIFI